MNIRTICFIGSGNVVNSLAPALVAVGYVVEGIIVRNPNSATDLATKLDVEAYSLDKIADIDSDCVIISVSDKAIKDIADKLSEYNGIVLHTSGSVGMDVLTDCKHYGVLYPLQTFSKSQPVTDFSNIPFFIEACDKETSEVIKTLAQSLSNKVEYADSLSRRALHVAAVFSCNFVNRMLADAFELCKRTGTDPSYLQPLVEETVRKAFATGDPASVQTGPAVRGDSLTIDKHLEALQGSPQYDVYKLLSHYISDAAKR